MYNTRLLPTYRYGYTYIIDKVKFLYVETRRFRFFFFERKSFISSTSKARQKMTICSEISRNGEKWLLVIINRTSILLEYRHLSTPNCYQSVWKKFQVVEISTTDATRDVTRIWIKK